MHFIKFEIKNFKGIEKAIIDLNPSGANVFTLIGLNESGKTTILEALSTFSIIKEDTDALYGANTVKVEPTSYVPKNLKSNFTGNITVTAFVKFDKGERESIVEKIQKSTGAKINLDCIPEIIEVTRGYRFENSDCKGGIYTMPLTLNAIPKGARKERNIPSSDDLWKEVTTHITKSIPQIIYFPTFLFNQPEKIILNPGSDERPVNRLYRQIIDNIAAALPNQLNVKQHIVERMLGDETAAEKIMSFFMLAPDKQQQIEASLNEMSAHVTETIFSSWKKIFGGDLTGRDIVLKTGIDIDESNERKVYIQFSIKDGKSSYDITERSLGFRWFFSFLLFTYYRVSNAGERPVLFLLDEPASNLHAKAQMQLIESFPKIAISSNQIMYSTHSHYLINPEWLDQAFIVSNKAIDYDNIDERNNRIGGSQTQIHVQRYRNFVGKNPDKVTYFQPVLDKLDFVPSRLDLTRPSVLMEGKGDFLIIEYGRRILLESKSNVCVVPTRGATGMDELIGLFMGWGIPFLICLDDDKEGLAARQKYLKEWGLSSQDVLTLSQITDDLKGKDVSGFLENSDYELIKQHFSLTGTPTKSQIQLYFSEHLSKHEKVAMSDKFIERITLFDNSIHNALERDKVNKKAA